MDKERHLDKVKVHSKIAEIHSMQRSIIKSKKVYMLGVGYISVRRIGARSRLVRFHEWRINRLSYALSSTEENVQGRVKMLWDRLCSHCRDALTGKLSSKESSPCRKDRTLYFEYALLKFAIGEECT